MSHARPLLALAAVVSLAACARTGGAPSDTSDAAVADVRGVTSSADGWTPLFDGRTTTGWRGYREKTMPASWHVVDGTLTKSGETNDIITDGEYGDFELELEWKLSPGGNSGVFYRATEEYEHPYWSGPEYQLLDDAGHPDGKSRLTAAGSDYGLYPSPAGIVKPAGEWNSSRIVVKGSHVEHWLNGQKLLEYELGSPEWEAKVRASKFAEWPNYGRAAKGHIAIQGDHDGSLAIRNVRIRELR